MRNIIYIILYYYYVPRRGAWNVLLFFSSERLLRASVCVGIILYYIIHTTTACPSPSIIFTQRTNNAYWCTPMCIFHIGMNNIKCAYACECVTRRIEKSGQKTDRQTDCRAESVGLCRGRGGGWCSGGRFSCTNLVCMPTT